MSNARVNRLLVGGAVFASLLCSVRAEAAETCGNGLDDDADGLADEGCYNLSSGVCESPLSCSETGMVSPLLGALRYQLPADVAPKVPAGPGIGMRRFYVSKYAPAAGAPVYRKPMGERWQHTYTTWLDKTGSPPTSKIVLHTNRGQDVLFSDLGPNPDGSGYEMYAAQAGFHVRWLRQKLTAPNQYELKMLTGETIVYDSGGKLTEIWDAMTPPQKVLIAYDGAGQVSTVTDASTKRRLLFAYTGAVLTSLQFQTNYTGSWITQHTTSYGYTSGNLTTVTIGGSLAQTNVYTSSYLTQIKDAANNNIATFAYTGTAGQVARIDTPHGMIGFEYNSTRAACTAKTVLHFNRGNTTACSTDAGCGAGFLCGGKTSTGTTGVCFRAARCLTVASPNEDVITNVAPLGPPSESCTGACTDVQQYVWNTGTGVLDLKATQDPAGNFTSRTFDANGMPTAIAFGDPDSDATNTNQARTEWRFYGNPSFPGRVTEIRRKSDLSALASSCSAGSSTGCAQTLFGYDAATGKVASVTELGFTRNIDGGIVPFNYVTAFSYDGKGRLIQIDGPLAGADDITTFDYFGATSDFSADFLKFINRKKNPTQFLTQEAGGYDFWGNPTSLKEPDATFTCLTFDAARGYLKNSTENMAGQTSCSSPNAADLQTKWTRDSALRLTQFTRPDGSCVFYEYDTKGRLLRIKRRDDCLLASVGDRQELLYDSEGLVTEVDTYDSAGVLTAKQPYTYFDSRRLEKALNPVDVTKWTGLTYDARGLLTQVDGAGGLGKTVYNRAGLPGSEGRVTSVDKYSSVAGSALDSWNLLYDWIGNQLQVTDGDIKATQTERDDLGRVTRLVSPDQTYPIASLYDAASRLTLRTEAFGGGAVQRRTSNTFDNLGRPLVVDYLDSSCFGATLPETERIYDAPPGGTCPIVGACSHTEGRLAYVRMTFACGGDSNTYDQETFYGYDEAGRQISETIRDNIVMPMLPPRQQLFSWTKNGALAQMTTPSGAILGWTYGSAASNSDADLITAQWRTSVATPVTSAVTWNPFGPLKQYNQQNTLTSFALRTRITRNLAYRPTGLFVETQTGGTVAQSVVLAEDVKGRITKRDYTPNTGGVQDSYFLYDDQDRVLCETTNLVASCPTSGATIKNVHSASPPFTHAGDWKKILRPSPGTTGLTNDINAAGYGTSHRVTTVNQSDGTPVLGTTSIGYDANGDRISDDNAGLAYDNRAYFHDQRHNLNTAWIDFKLGGSLSQLQSYSGFDARNRRMSKTVWNATPGIAATWDYYYDPYDRLTEIRYVPNYAVPATYSIFQLFWLGDRITAYWQTDYPAVATTKRYVGTDETSRPIDMMSWPPSGDATRVWSINPSAWGFDTNSVGPGIFQPVLFAGQYQDSEMTAYRDDGVTVHRPALALNGFRSYDPFVGGYLQVDPMSDSTWSSFVYVDSNPVGRRDPLGLEGSEHPDSDSGPVLHEGWTPGGVDPGSIEGAFGRYFGTCSSFECLHHPLPPSGPPPGGGGGSGSGGNGGNGGGGRRGGTWSGWVQFTPADLDPLDDPAPPKLHPGQCLPGKHYDYSLCTSCIEQCQDEVNASFEHWCEFLDGGCDSLSLQRALQHCYIAACSDQGRPCEQTCMARPGPSDSSPTGALRNRSTLGSTSW